MIFERILKRRRTSRPLARRGSTTPGIRLGRYASGLDAVWAWEQCAHLLMVEREDYGAGENLVRHVARAYPGDRVQLAPKVRRDEEYYGLSDLPPWWFASSTSCATQVARLNLIALERAARIENGEDVEPMLVTVPELHDILEAATLPAAYDESEAGKSLLIGLQRLLKTARAGRIHVLANIRQGYFYRVYLPRELLGQFSGRLVLGKTDRRVTELLGLSETFDRPHGLLGDLGEGFWPLEVRR